MPARRAIHVSRLTRKQRGCLLNQIPGLGFGLGDHSFAGASVFLLRHEWDVRWPAKGGVQLDEFLGRGQ